MKQAVFVGIALCIGFSVLLAVQSDEDLGSPVDLEPAANASLGKVPDLQLEIGPPGEMISSQTLESAHQVQNSGVEQLLREMQSLDHSQEDQLRALAILTQLAEIPNRELAQESIFHACQYSDLPIVGADAAGKLIEMWQEDPQLVADAHALFLMSEGGVQRLIGWYGILWCAQERFDFPAEKYLDGFVDDLMWSYENDQDEALRIAMAGSADFMGDIDLGLQLVDGMAAGPPLHTTQRLPGDIAIRGLTKLARAYLFNENASPHQGNRVYARLLQLSRTTELSKRGGEELVDLLRENPDETQLRLKLREALLPGPARDVLLKYLDGGSG